MIGILEVFFYRTCTKNHKLGKINIKKGTIVNYPGYYIHHNEKYFQNPEKFDIHRFGPENLQKIQRRSFTAFGLGQRACAGVELGYAMMNSVILSLLSQFEVEQDPDFNPLWKMTFSLEMPKVILRLKPR